MHRPHPATVIATLALAGVWVAPAISAALIDSAAVKNESLTGRDIRNRSITGADIRANSVSGGDVTGLTGRDLLGDSLDGFNIYEPGLAKVPAAERADSAAAADAAGQAAVAAKATTADTVNGLHVAKVAWAKPGGTGTEDLIDVAGIKLRARCGNPARLELEAIPAAPGGAIHVGYTRQTNETAPGYRGDDDMVGGQVFEVLPAGADNVQGTLTYLSRQGGVLSLTFLADSGVSGPAGNGCIVAGTAVGG